MTHPLHTSSLNFGFLNVCSLRHKVEEVSTLMKTHTITILGIAETWLNDSVSDGEVQVPGYQIIRRDRPDRQGGGVAFYVRDDIPVSGVQSCEDSATENIVIDVTADKHTFRLCCIYRPPSAPVSFWSKFELC